MVRRVRRRHTAFRATGASSSFGPKRSLRILLIALGLLIAQGPQLLHLLLTPHTTCEHGKLVELRSPEQRELTAPESGAQQDRAVAAHADGAGHDHCDAFALRHVPAEIGPGIAASSLLAIEPLLVLQGRDGSRPVSLLSLAPKSSPPTS